MGWSSKDYSYTKEEIDRTAFAAGCGKGWFWIHKRPNMFLGGYINDDGTYQLTLYKPIKSQFDYTLKITINDIIVFKFPEFSALDKKSYKSTISGKLPIGTMRAYVKLYCGDKHCDVGAGGNTGTTIIDVDLWSVVRIMYNGVWHRAVPYIMCDGKWKLCRSYIMHDKSWKIMNNN